jgi:AbrB family looped-hinge helix DNA binding protein
MTCVTVSSKYQVVIPKEVRRKLGIKAGTRLQALPDQAGFRLVKEPTIEEIPGLLQGLPVVDENIRSEEDRSLP